MDVALASITRVVDEAVKEGAFTAGDELLRVQAALRGLSVATTLVTMSDASGDTVRVVSEATDEMRRALVDGIGGPTGGLILAQIAPHLNVIDHFTSESAALLQRGIEVGKLSKRAIEDEESSSSVSRVWLVGGLLSMFGGMFGFMQVAKSKFG